MSDAKLEEELWSRPQQHGRCAVFSSDGRWVFTAERDIRIHDAETGDELRVLCGHKEFVNCLDFSPDGAVVAIPGTGPNINTVVSGISK